MVIEADRVLPENKSSGQGKFLLQDVVHAEQWSQAEFKACNIVLSQALLDSCIEPFSHNLHRFVDYRAQNLKIVDALLVLLALIITQVFAKLSELFDVY